MQEPGLIKETLPDAIPGLTGVGIGAYQPVNAFSTLNSNINAPGVRTIFNTPLSRGIRRNKTSRVSNETIVAPVRPAIWRNGYQTKQRTGESIFVGDPRQKLERIDMETLSLAQINSVLKAGYEKVKQVASDRRGRMLNEFEQEIIVADAFCADLMAEMKEKGEGIFDDETRRQNAAFKMAYQYVINISRRMILEKWRLLGTYFSDDGSGPEFTAASGRPMINLAVGGPTRDVETFNVWGASECGQVVGFILKRRLLKAQSTTTMKVYGEFYFKPWCSRHHEPVPPPEKLRYLDDAGFVQFGTFIPAGRVSESPLRVSPREQRMMVAGITANDTQAFTIDIETVAIIVGPTRCFIDLYQC